MYTPKMSGHSANTPTNSSAGATSSRPVLVMRRDWALGARPEPRRPEPRRAAPGAAPRASRTSRLLSRSGRAGVGAERGGGKDMSALHAVQRALDATLPFLYPGSEVAVVDRILEHLEPRRAGLVVHRVV